MIVGNMRRQENDVERDGWGKRVVGKETREGKVGRGRESSTGGRERGAKVCGKEGTKGNP